MGFREGAYATVWEVRPGGDTWTKGRISVSRKTESGAYESDFEDFVMFSGTSAASKALKLKPKDRIKLLRVDATTSFDKNRNIKYHNYRVYEFEDANRFEQNAQQTAAASNTGGTIGAVVDDGEVDTDLPF